MRLSIAAVSAVIGTALVAKEAGAFRPGHAMARGTVSSLRNNISTREEDPPAKPLVENEYTSQSERQQFDFSDPTAPVVFGQRLVIPFTNVEYDFGNGYKNDGAFAWMVPYASLMGFQVGNHLTGGIAETAGPSSFSPEKLAAMRQDAADNLINISDEERATRALYGQYAYAAAGIVAAVSALTLDDGGLSGHVTRLAVLPILFLARGYELSAQSGL